MSGGRRGEELDDHADASDFVTLANGCYLERSAK
jgi:hypothetical protein